MNSTATSSFLPSPPLLGVDGVETFVTTRRGGFSAAPYISFNCSPFVGDPDAEMNLLLLSDRLQVPLSHIVIPHQIHRTTLFCVDESFMSWSAARRRANLEGVDGLITHVPDYFLCITTADCLPVFFYDPVNRAIGIAHSGWRGTVGHIACLVLQQMNRCYRTDPKAVRVAFGPCISSRFFEVGEEVYEVFRKEGFPMDRIALRCMRINEEGQLYGRWHLSLQEAVAADLRKAGVPDSRIERCPVCSYADNTLYSVRRQGMQTGRTLNGIRLKSMAQD